MITERAIDVLGVRIDVVTLDEALRRIETFVETSDRPGGCHVVTANPEMILAALEPGSVPSLKKVLDDAELVVADGIGVVWASRLQGSPLPERVPGVDLAASLLEMAAQKGWRVFLLGGEPGVAAEAARRMMQKHTDLRVVGTDHGYFTDDDAIVQKIAAADVDLLLVGMGVPKQEHWIAAHRRRLRARVMMGVGGALDVFAGRVRRAPLIWQRVGLEWAYRLLQQPRRIGRMAALPRFVIRVLRHRRTAKE